MPLETRILNPLDRPDWDDVLPSFPDASIFHTAAWARVLAESYGYRPRYVAAFDGDRIVALLPMMEVRSWLTGRRGVSLPFTDYCEPLAANEEALHAVMDAALRLACDGKWKHVEFRSERCFASGKAASLAYWRHTIALEREENAMFARLKGNVRSNIRKAIASGVKVEVLDTMQAVRDFCRLNSMTRRIHGLPPQPFSFFRSLHAHLIGAGAGVVVCAAVEGRPVGASVYLFRGNRAIYKYGASDHAYQALRVNDLVMWEALRWLTGRGCATMSMGKTAMENDGLRRFKLGWGAEESELKYFKYDVRAQAFVKDRDAIAGWHNRVFRHMPLPAARVAGALLYRHMA